MSRRVALALLAVVTVPAVTVGSARLVGGADAAGLTAKAYARVISNGTFDAARSRNVTAVTRVGTGFYRLGVSVTVKNVVASVNAASAPALALAGLVGSTVDGGVSCPSSAKLFVRTFTPGGTPADVPFYVVAH